MKTTDLNIDEAKKALKEGYKLTHRYFTPKEFIHMKDGILYDENNFVLTGFWEIRESTAFKEGFKDGWSIIK